jgi:hypothetical protein
MRFTDALGISLIAGPYVPELSQPHAVHTSENSPPCIERSTLGDEHIGQLIEVFILDLGEYA